MKKQPKIIVITGTKGKTTIAFTLDLILRSINKKTLCINSEGLFKNGTLIKDNAYFLKKYKTSVNVCGLKELAKINLSLFDYLILESSYSSYKKIRNFSEKNKIDLSVLTNVYWDHIDGVKIKNQAELLEKKYQVLLSTKKSGVVLVYNGDKKNNVSHKIIPRLASERPDLKITAYNEKFFAQGPKKAFLKKNSVFLDGRSILNLKKLDNPLNLNNPVLKLNILVLAVILKKLKLNPKKIYAIKNIFSVVPGRFNFFEKNGCKIILDYAHEIKSLTLASSLLKKTFPKLKIKAVVRFSYYRKDAYIKNLVRDIAGLFDSFIVYDKAVSRPALRKIFIKKYNRKSGAIGKLVKHELLKAGAKTILIADELSAIKKAIQTLKTNELLYIMGDQITKDIKTIKKTLNKK